jgi:hypothetical protein
MKVTIIYDIIYITNDDNAKIDYANVQTIIFGEDVRYFVQNIRATNYRYRGFDTLDDVVDFVRYESMQDADLAEFAFKTKYAFRTESEMCKWISSLCESTDDLTEIFIK